jgi:hypothetical protein
MHGGCKKYCFMKGKERERVKREERGKEGVREEGKKGGRERRKETSASCGG